MTTKNIWFHTHSGIAFDLLDPKPEMIVFSDVFWSLAHQARYNGHAAQFISIAEHSVRVAVIAEALFGKAHRRCGLGHDFPESITGDVPSPVIKMLNSTIDTSHDTWSTGLGAWAKFVFPIERAFAERMALPELVDLPKEVKRADCLALMLEKEACLAASPRPPGDGWPIIDEAEIAEAQKAWRAYCRTWFGALYAEFGWTPSVARATLTSEAFKEGWF